MNEKCYWKSKVVVFLFQPKLWSGKNVVEFALLTWEIGSTFFVSLMQHADVEAEITLTHIAVFCYTWDRLF